MKFEICGTSKASVAQPLWQKSKEEECFSFSVSPISVLPLLPISLHPSLSAASVSPELGEGRGV